MGGPAINGTTSSWPLALFAAIRFAIHSLKESNLVSLGARVPAAVCRRRFVLSPATPPRGSPLLMSNHRMMLVMATTKTRDILSDREVIPGLRPLLVISY